MKFNDTGVLYIADGHHRSAAASRVAVMRRQKTMTPKPAMNTFSR